MDRERLPEIFENIRRALSQVKSDFVNMEKLREKTERDIEKLANQLYVPIDRYAEFINDSPVSIFDYISEPVLLLPTTIKSVRKNGDHSKGTLGNGYRPYGGRLFVAQCQNGLFSMEHFNEFLFSFPKSVYYAPFTPQRRSVTPLIRHQCQGGFAMSGGLTFNQGLAEMLKDRIR